MRKPTHSKVSLHYGFTANTVRDKRISTTRPNISLGVVKTHRLLLLTPASLMAPGALDASNESRLTIGPKALKDLLDHFPVSKGARSDPQLVWTFEENEVTLKSVESSIDSRGALFQIVHLFPSNS